VPFDFSGSDAGQLLSGAPPGFCPAIKLLVSRAGVSSALPGAAGVDEDDNEAEGVDHSGLDANDEDFGDQSGAGTSAGEGGGEQTDDGLHVGGDLRKEGVLCFDASLPWVCPAQAAGVRAGDIITQIDEKMVSSVEMLIGIFKSDAVQNAISLTLTLERTTGSSVKVLRAIVFKGSHGKLNLSVGSSSSGVLVVKLDPAEASAMPLPTPPSPVLLCEIAAQIHGINNKQCESTQWLIKSDRDALRVFLVSYVENGGLFLSDIAALESAHARKSVVRLIGAARYDGLGGKKWLHPAIFSMLNAMVVRADFVHSEALSTPARVPVSPDKAIPYDPSTGIAYHFTESGGRLYHWQ
jgi:hypothetical protein